MSLNLTLLVETGDPAECEKALAAAIRKIEWWPFRRRGEIGLKAGPDGWLVASLPPRTKSAGSLAEAVSAALHARTLLMATDAVSGTEEIVHCVDGETVRWLWYSFTTDGLFLFADEGEPLDFEQVVKERRRREAEAKLAAMPEDTRDGHRRLLLHEGNLLPRAADFAEALGCPME